MIARRNQGASAQDGIVGLGLFHGNLAETVQAVGKRAGEHFGHVLHDDDAGSVGRQDFEQRPQGLGAARGRADNDDLFGGFEHGGRGAREDGVRGQLRLHGMATAREDAGERPPPL